MSWLFTLLACVLPFLAFPAAAEGRLRTAVAAFADAEQGADGGLVGLEAAFFLERALSGFPGLELRRLPVPDGEAGLDRVLVGSYELGEAGLYIEGRFVDASSGETLAAASAEAPPAESYCGAYAALLSGLLKAAAGLEPDFAHEARVGLLRDSWSPRVGGYLRAAAALRAGDADSAASALEKALAGPFLPFPGYPEAARLLAELRPQTAPAPANALLAGQFEALSIRHRTLRSAKPRLAALLTADAFALPDDFASSVRMTVDGAVKRVRLPDVTGPALRPEARIALLDFFSGSGVAALGPSSLVSSPAPAGPLLRPESLAGGFDLAVRALLSHRVLFLDGEGRTLFELVSRPAAVLSLGPGEARFAAEDRATYSVGTQRPAWTYRPDGTVEIGPSEASALKTVRYAVDPSSLSLELSFPLESEQRWESLLAHAYRKRSVSAAAVKDVVVTDSFFPSGDPELGRVPALPRNGRLAGFTRLSAVAYLSPGAGSAASAVWSGAVSGEAAPAGNSGEAISVFEAPEAPVRRYGPLSVAVKAGGAAAVSASALLGNGRSWSVDVYPNEFALAGALVVTDAGTAYSARDGGTRWDGRPRGYPVPYDRSSVLLVGGTAMHRLSLETGEELAEYRYPSKGRIFHASREGDVLFVLSEFGGLESVDARSGRRNWGARSGGDRVFTLDSGRIYAGDGKVYDARTGTLLFYTDGRGRAAFGSDAVAWENGVGTERSNGRRRWRLPGIAGTPVVDGGRAYFGGTGAVELRDGAVLWRRNGGGTDSFLADGTLYAWSRRRLDAVDPRTGTTKWSCYGDRPTARVSDGFLFGAFDEGGLVGYDLAAFSRGFSPAEHALRGRLDADLVDSGLGDQPARGAYVASVVRGGRAEAAGLLPGDYISEAAGYPVRSAEDARDRIYALSRDEPFRVKVSRMDPRDGKRTDTTLTLRAAAAGDPAGREQLRPGFRLGMIGREALRDRRLDHIARFDSFIVEAVLPRSPAADAGLAVGDILVQVDSTALDASFLSENFRRLYAAIAAAMPRRAPVVLTVIRGGERRTLAPLRP